MNPFKKNGLVAYNENDIINREYVIRYISKSLEDSMKSINRAWDFKRVETSQLIPIEAVSSAYDKSDFFSVGDDMALRPETTWGSYEILKDMLHTEKLPLCVWQVGKSFRNEQDKTFANIRFKEFYQMEFQMAYSKDSKADYYTHALKSIQDIIGNFFPVTNEESDRLPAYSIRTMDIVTCNKNQEIASISLRNDFDHPVVEVAIGLDRILYNMGHNNGNVR